MSVNNPAGRLHALMNRALEVPMSTMGEVAWEQVLGDADEDEVPRHVLLERLALVVMLPGAIRRSVETIADVDHSLYLRHIGMWENAFTSRIRFDAQWSHFMDPFNGERLYSLETCNELLSRQRPEPTLTDEFIQETATELDDLRERVRDSKMDDDVREFILAGLNRMREALRHYRFSGIPPVIDALEASIGAAHLQPDVFRRSKESDLGAEYWSGLEKVYGRIQPLWGPYQAIKGAVVDVLSLPSGP